MSPWPGVWNDFCSILGGIAAFGEEVREDRRAALYKATIEHNTMRRSTLYYNTLYYGDNLCWIQDWDAESVDLVYLDPPFNSNENYNLIFATGGDFAQAQAFQDTWRWGEQAAVDRDLALRLGGRMEQLLEGLERILGATGMFAYLCHLAPRVYHLRRLLKPTGSLYLHCDDVAGHYVKVLLDAVFGAAQYRNQIVWRRSISHNNAQRFGRIVDLIFFYGKSAKAYWNGESTTPRSEEALRKAYPARDARGRYRSENLTAPLRGSGGFSVPWRGYDVRALGRSWAVPGKKSEYARFIEERFIPGYRQIEGVHKRLEALEAAGLLHHPQRGKWLGLKRYAEADRSPPPQNLILEPTGFTNYKKGAEYLGYPTQKPEGLLRKLIHAACPAEGVVLDPYCGCGTTIHVAQETGRPWIGIDITHLAIGIVEQRFHERLGVNPRVIGRPENLPAAQALFAQDAHQFEAWAIALIQGLVPNQQQGGGSRVVGRGYAPVSGGRQLVIAHVTGAESVGAAAVRDLNATLAHERASLGVLIVMDRKNLTHAAERELEQGTVEIDGQRFPKLQAFTIQDHFAKRDPTLPILLSHFRGRDAALDLVDRAQSVSDSR